MTLDESQDTQRGCVGTEALIEVLEGRATDAARARIEAHAARCDACRLLLSTLLRGSQAGEPTPASASQHRIGGAIGRYEIRVQLGAGGMGVVYAAYDPALDRTVAVKVLRGERSADLEARLRREAMAMAKLAHPNIVNVHDVGTAVDRTFLAMEYVEGETVATWTQTEKPSREAILDVYRQAGRGLAAAHAGGLVHRDFKPENAMLGADGRVRVVDFGLAYAGADPAPVIEAVAARDTPLVSPDGPTVLSSSSHRTEPGTIVGTPFYMAPELYEGAPADARSDQFSFCLALYVALFGERPFVGDSYQPRPVPSARGVSRRIRAALRRGLSADPSARFATMDELLAAIAKPARRWPWIAAAAAVPAAAAIAFGVASMRHEAPCGGADAHLAGAWDGRRRAAVERALRSTDVPYAAAAWESVSRSLDRYAGDWKSMQIGACEATRVRGEQSEAVMDLRMSCLDEHLRDLRSLTAQLARADRTAAEHAVAAAADLPPISECADIAALQTRVRPPSAALKAHVEELRASLGAIRTDHALGRYREAAAALPAVLAQSRATGYRPLEAEALALDGAIARDTEQFVRARAALEEALLNAEAGRDDHEAAAVAIALVSVVGIGVGKPQETPPLRARAAALLERIDQPADLRIQLASVSGRVLGAAGQLAEAERELRSAVDLAEQRYGKEDAHIVEPLRDLARFEVARDNAAVGLPYLQRALAIQRAVLGPAHPDVAETTMAVGGALYASGKYDEALAQYEVAKAIFDRALGPDSASSAAVLDDMALAYEWKGDLEKAVELHRRALAIVKRVRGENHPLTLTYEGNLAATLAEVDQPAESIALLEDVLARQRALYGGDHPSIALTLENLALSELSLKRFAAARDHATESRAMYGRVVGATYNPIAESTSLGEALLGLGDAAAAVDALSDARAHVLPTTDAGTGAWIDAQLGRALVDSGKDPARGRALVLAAWKTVSTDERMTDERARLLAWMKSRSLAPRA